MRGQGPGSHSSDWRRQAGASITKTTVRLNSILNILLFFYQIPYLQYKISTSKIISIKKSTLIHFKINL